MSRWCLEPSFTVAAMAANHYAFNAVRFHIRSIAIRRVLLCVAPQRPIRRCRTNPIESCPSSLCCYVVEGRRRHGRTCCRNFINRLRVDGTGIHLFDESKLGVTAHCNHRTPRGFAKSRLIQSKTMRSCSIEPLSTIHLS